MIIHTKEQSGGQNSCENNTLMLLINFKEISSEKQFPRHSVKEHRQYVVMDFIDLIKSRDFKGF